MMIAFRLLLSFFVVVSLHAMEKDTNIAIIPGASYMVHQNDTEIVFGVPQNRESKLTRFYSSTGEHLDVREHKDKDFESMYKLLDPLAPKPQPVKCCIRYWDSSIYLQYNNKEKYISSPGDYLVFYDKHGNKITSFPFEDHTVNGNQNGIEWKEENREMGETIPFGTNKEPLIEFWIRNGLNITQECAKNITDMRQEDGKPDELFQDGWLTLSSQDLINLLFNNDNHDSGS